VLVVACLSVACVRVCLQRGVQLVLLLLPLVPEFLRVWLGWLMEWHCAVLMLVACIGIPVWTTLQLMWLV
jgi:hypothetical protein